jgi:thiamine-phosphate pyrophosphorylase
MLFPLPKVYPITDIALSGLSHAEQVEMLGEGGATFIQLREKVLSPLDFFLQAGAAVEVARRRGMQVIINDRVDIALAVRAHGVHLGQNDLPPEAARRLLGADSTIGYSTHNIEQVQRALALPIDYLAIGPIFPTTSKADTEPVVGLDGLRAVRNLVTKLPIVAIGGITPQNAKAVIEAGATSVAVISNLVSDPTRIAERTRSLLESINLGT